MRISDWSSDVCSSDLVFLYPQAVFQHIPQRRADRLFGAQRRLSELADVFRDLVDHLAHGLHPLAGAQQHLFHGVSAIHQMHQRQMAELGAAMQRQCDRGDQQAQQNEDRKSTRLNSSHSCASRMPSSARKKKNTTTPYSTDIK